ncbi:uncharacterized protein LOC144101685 [Amblyomma americanum]
MHDFFPSAGGILEPDDVGTMGGDADERERRRLPGPGSPPVAVPEVTRESTVPPASQTLTQGQPSFATSRPMTATVPSTTRKTPAPPTPAPVPPTSPSHPTTPRTRMSSRGTPTSTKCTKLNPKPMMPMKADALFCTYGSRTHSQMPFPGDGVCDYIFYDSVYKDGRNTLSTGSGFEEDLNVVLSKACDHNKTEFGVAFGCAQRKTLQTDLSNAAPLEVFWQSAVYHFGVIDCAAVGLTPAVMDEVFVALEALDRLARTQRGQGRNSYIVLGATSHTDTWNNYFKDKFKNVLKPDLFISHGHYLLGDPEMEACVIIPPTLLRKRRGSREYVHDLTDAAAAISAIASDASAPLLSLSVGMKGRWTKPLDNQRLQVFAQCKRNEPAQFFGSYTDICNKEPYRSNMVNQLNPENAHTTDKNARLMFVFDSSASLNEKLCLLKADHTSVRFGLAVYDLDYEDYNDTCRWQNSVGGFGRVQTVRSLLNFFVTNYTDATKLYACRRLY